MHVFFALIDFSLACALCHMSLKVLLHEIQSTWERIA